MRAVTASTFDGHPSSSFSYSSRTHACSASFINSTTAWSALRLESASAAFLMAVCLCGRATTMSALRCKVRCTPLLFVMVCQPPQSLVALFLLTPHIPIHQQRLYQRHTVR